jgi:hypothetical protein
VEIVRLRKSSLFLLLLLLWTTFVAAQAPAPPKAYFAYQFTSREEVEEALRTAKIIKAKWLGTGITNPQKLTLDNGKFQFYGVFKTIDERKQGLTKMAAGAEMDFKDSWMFEVAAYELDKLLGLNMVPVTVERMYEGKKGSLQLWIENAMTEKVRKEKNLSATNVADWNHQIFKVRLFDNLIYNIDRNLGNLLITADWKIYMIDHSRSFKNFDVLQHPKDMSGFSRALVEAIRKLDEKTVIEHCGKYLSPNEIRMMLKRRDQIIALCDQLHQEKGEAIFYP